MARIGSSVVCGWISFIGRMPWAISAFSGASPECKKALNAKKPTLCRSLTLVGRGRPVSFPVPPMRGVWRAEQALNLGSVRQSARHAAFPLSLQRAPAAAGPISSRSGFCPGSRPGAQLRTTPGGAASCPAIKTPLDDALAADRTL
jgi:hypothetical protein